MRALLAMVVVSVAGCSDAHAVEAVTTHELTVGDGARITVDSDGGAITFRPGPAGHVHVEAHRKAGTREQALALPVEVVADGGGARITFHKKERGLTHNESVSFVVQAPANAQLALETGGGPVDVSGFHGSVAVRTGGGPIHAQDLDGTLTASTGGGSIDVSGAKLHGANTLESGGGPIRCTVAAGSKLRAEASTGGGPVRNELDSGDGSDGSLRVRTGGGPITLTRAR